VGVVTIWLSGCAPTQEQHDVEQVWSGEESVWDVEEVTREIMLKNYRLNAPDLFCSQPSYTSCFDITREQCIKELNSVAPDCHEKAQEKVGRPTSLEMVDEVGDFMLRCMGFYQTGQHADDADDANKILICLEFFSFDDARLQRSIKRGLVK
jgi:hypothetical protein